MDRSNLGRQTYDEFANFQPPDDARKFPELYTVQRLTANAVNPAAKVVVTTVQRLYSMLRGEVEYDAGNEEGSAFDSAGPWAGEPPRVEYNAALPPEFFDFVVVDECHRSIYDLWSQVLLYFDAFLIGLTATPAGKTVGFFNQNLVMQYGHREAVADGVNVDFDVYRIRTRVTEEGATIEAAGDDVFVDVRNKLTRAERLKRLEDDLTYTANDLDQDVVSESQIRTVLRQFRDKVLPAAFPDRGEVPKTLIREAVTPFLKPALRRRILEIRRQNEQTIDRRTIDEALYSGFDAAAVEKARGKVQDFRAWIDEHRDELTALQAIYAGSRPLRLSLTDLRRLRDALARPPLSATPVQLWRAFEAVEPAKVKGAGGEPLPDLVNLVRGAMLPSFTLMPYRDESRERYRAWLAERDADNTFTPEQREWLDRMAAHIASSLAIEPADFETGWFGQQGSLGRAHALFGHALRPLMTELNERLAA